jgi:hypothetical protein
MTEQGFVYNAPGPVIAQFVRSDAFVCGIRGPFGSGKSTAAVIKLLSNSRAAARHADGWIRRRTGIIRNTYPELRTTTIKTWHQWMPQSMGRWVDQGPPTHHLRDEAGKIEWEVVFVALDRPDDVRKLLSMELSDAWVNEAREIPKEVIDGLTGRVGRWMPVRGGDNRTQIVMDTNPPDTDHWWYVMAERDVSTEYGMGIVASIDEAEKALRAMGALRPARVDGDGKVLEPAQAFYQFFAQPGGLAAGAENVENLPLGYYQKLMAGKTKAWVDVYVNGNYGFLSEGKPVYPEYKDEVHCKEFALHPKLPIGVGLDFGLTPAAVIGQRQLNGQYRLHREVVANDMGMVRFAKELARVLRSEYKDFHIAYVVGDPAGMQRAQSDESTVFQMLRAQKLEAHPATTNDFNQRREAVAAVLNRLIDGEPGMLVHPQAAMLRKALAGGYHYKRIQLAGEARYGEIPNKNKFSHVGDAIGYYFLAAGEHKELLRVRRDRPLPTVAVTNEQVLE